MSFLPLSHPTEPASSSPAPPPPPPPPPSSLRPFTHPETTTPIPANIIPSELPAAPNALTNSTSPPNPTTLPNPPSQTPPPHPPNFAPFFTLLSNAGSPTTHHPRISYIFSDDDPDTDPITAAALHILNPTSSLPSPTRSSEERRSDGRNGLLTKERYILLDMDATGSRVLSAQSMSPDWAVTATELAPAPTWDDTGGGGGGGEVEGRELMLRIEGMEVLGSVEGDDGDGKGKGKGLEELVGMYESRMGELRKVVDAGAGVGV